MAKWLIHAYEGPEANPDLVHRYDDHDYRFPPREPVEVPSDFIADKIVEEQGPIYGYVEVPVTKSRSGISFDVESAQKKAAAYLLANRKARIVQWATEMIQDRVRQNLPALPPNGFVAESIKLLNVDIKKRFGFKPVGFDFDADGPAPAAAKPDADVADLQETVRRLLERVEVSEAQARNAEADRNQLEEDLVALRAEREAA